MSNREIIFGVFLKSNKSYFGYFKNEADAIKELKIQGAHLYPNEKYDSDLNQIIGRDGKKLITIHAIVLR